MTGLLFDIKKFAVHDGPGIRSTVFLKGCPLRCVWCQNPEGLELNRHLWYFENRCIRCGKCLESCLDGVVTKGGPGEPFIKINSTLSLTDKHCIDVCPTNALTFDSREATVDDIVATLLEDRLFYEKSGGGITLSGGDPIFQHPFSLAILKACKAEGLHTAMETSMFTSKAVFERFFNLVDYFIVDIKIFDKEAHKKYIGQDNGPILENFRYLAQNKKDVLVRIPLIPGITDSDDNIRAIAGFVARHSEGVPIELINYNPLADSKYRLMDMAYDLKGAKPLSEDAVDHLNAIIEGEGVVALRTT